MYKLPGIESSEEILQQYNSHVWLKVNKDDLIVMSFDFPVEKTTPQLTSSEKIISHAHESLALNQYLSLVGIVQQYDDFVSED